jgi:hypothetical protein
MKSHRHVHLQGIIFMVLILVLAQLACTTSKVQQLASAVPSLVAPDPNPEGPVEQGPGPAPTRPQTRLNTPTPPPEPLHLLSQGFGQAKQELGYAFLVENPNPGVAFENSHYQIAVYDASGAVVDTDSGYIELVLPGQKLGIGGTIYFSSESMKAAKIEVQLGAGDPTSTDLDSTFTADNVTYHPGDYFSKATGMISNPFDRDITDLRLSAVAYDNAGEIIGGGFSYLDFILANGTTAAEVSVTSSGEVDHLELYPTLSGLSWLTSGEQLPADAQKLALLKQGFGQKDTQVGYGMVIQNPNHAYAVESARYHINLYAEDGSVLKIEQGYIDLLLPDQTLGVGASTYLDDKTPVARADFQVLSGRYEAAGSMPFFTSQNISYLDSSYYPKVTGEILSPYTKDISNIRVSAIAYDQDGEIIGGGYTYLDFVPANGKSAAEIPVACKGTPVSLEVFASVTSLSDFDR